MPPAGERGTSCRISGTQLIKPRVYPRPLQQGTWACRYKQAGVSAGCIGSARKRQPSKHDRSNNRCSEAMSSLLALRLPSLARQRTLFRLGYTSAARSLLTQSHYKGPSSPPLLEYTLGNYLAEVASQHGDSNA
ncbi:hypothetical protein BDZ91DRAFT_427833 [Kalaharituber pfeilii]|nr:hypothetical protein BDZ91DRAFT_427833 [Kalaharituber pfeilii]